VTLIQELNCFPANTNKTGSDQSQKLVSEELKLMKISG